VLSADKKGAAVKDEFFVVQVIENKKKEQSSDKTSNIKQRLILSDGTSSLIAMVTKNYNAIEVSP
jgi:hypothetical protein